MTKKLRLPIPDNVAAEILFVSDRTCCVCNIRGKQVQIHHIDENPANNNTDNLSILCFECHNDTMIKGGFGRKLEAKQIVKYRDEWHERVKERKAKADEIASIQTVAGVAEIIIATEINEEDFLDYKTYYDSDLLKEYLNKIIIIHQAQLTIARTKWNSVVTTTMNQGSYDMIDFYEEVLIELSTFYPKGHFNNQTPEKYFSELISSRFLWNRPILEPKGAGTGGTIVSTMTGGSVMDDLKNMIIDMVNALLWPYDIDEQVDLTKWKED
ncbi:MAG: HNH endonuclease signature motif containing protein [Janthinobacterium lividum]